MNREGAENGFAVISVSVDDISLKVSAANACAVDHLFHIIIIHCDFGGGFIQRNTACGINIYRAAGSNIVFRDCQNDRLSLFAGSYPAGGRNRHDIAV